MTPPAPSEPSRSTTLAAPTPTHPVAGRPVDSDEPVFDWTRVPGASHYRLQVAESETFDTLYADDRAERPTSLSLQTILPDHVDGACWRVRAEHTSGTSAWSDAAHFVRSTADAVPESAVRVDASPRPVHPRRQDVSVERRAAEFSWEEIPEATGYQLQIAPTEDFADPHVDVTVDQTTAVTLYDALPADPSPLYWRLRSLFPVGQPGPWSGAIRFTVSTQVRERENTAGDTAGTKEYARAAGPVLESRTSGRLSIAISLIALLSFIATIVLIALLG